MWANNEDVIIHSIRAQRRTNERDIEGLKAGIRIYRRAFVRGILNCEQYYARIEKSNATIARIRRDMNGCSLALVHATQS